MLTNFARTAAVFAASFIFAGVLSNAALGKPRPEGPEVLVSADAISGPEEFRPTPDHPIYYILGQIYAPLADPIAGIKLPTKAQIEQAVTAELAKQGYVRTEVGGPMPSIFILTVWGESNFNPWDEQPNDKLSLRRVDRGKMENIIGLAKNFDSLGDEQKIVALTNDDRLYVSICAFDALTFKKEKRLLWRTSMSMDWKNDFALALPVLLASGGPSFGRNVTAPSFYDDRDRRNFDVKIGEAKVVPADPASDAKREDKK